MRTVLRDPYFHSHLPPKYQARVARSSMLESNPEHERSRPWSSVVHLATVHNDFTSSYDRKIWILLERFLAITPIKLFWTCSIKDGDTRLRLTLFNTLEQIKMFPIRAMKDAPPSLLVDGGRATLRNWVEFCNPSNAYAILELLDCDTRVLDADNGALTSDPKTLCSAIHSSADRRALISNEMEGAAINISPIIARVLPRRLVGALSTATFDLRGLLLGLGKEGTKSLVWIILGKPANSNYVPKDIAKPYVIGSLIVLGMSRLISVSPRILSSAT